MITPLRASLEGHDLRQHQENSLATAVVQAKADQLAEMAKHEAAGDWFAAYYAGSASASVAHHVRRGAVINIRAGR